MLSNYLYIGLGGFLGAICRYGMSKIINGILPLAFVPLGTIAVNTIGSFSLAFLMAASAQKYTISPHTLLFLGTGLLGAFTTYSTFTYEAVALYQHSLFRGILYSIIMLLSGFLFAIAGFLLGRN